MLVLVGCECSQIVTAAFIAAGHDAYSCDLEPSYGAYPERHFQGDIKEVYELVKPDLFICHPPCTYLSNVGTPLVFRRGGEIKDFVRYEKGLFARDLFLWALSRPCDMVAVENPIPMKCWGLPKPTQYIEPYLFGDPYTKHTGLWLRGLPALVATDIVKPIGSWTHIHYSPRIRSQTFRGIAKAMAAQWIGKNAPGYQFCLEC